MPQFVPVLAEIAIVFILYVTMRFGETNRGYNSVHKLSYLLHTRCLVVCHLRGSSTGSWLNCVESMQGRRS